MNRHVKVLIAFTAATLLAATGSLRAQDVDALLTNTRQTQTIVALDRTVYFPGEAAAITVAVKNPTAAPLTVLAPFTSATGCLNLLTLSGGTGPSVLASERLCTGGIDSSTPSTVLAAGEQRVRTLKSYDPMFELGTYVMDVGGGVPRDPDYYTLEYNYAGSGGTIAAFQVVAAHLDAASVARVADISYVDPTSNQTESLPAYMHAFALRWQNKTWICATLEPTSVADPPLADAQGNFTDRVTPYVRVASSQNPVSSLTLTADASGNLTLQWRDSTGAQQTISLGAAPPAPTPATVALAIDPPWAGLGSAQDMQFNAVTSSSDSSVTWSVALDANAPTGAQPGAISSTGLYLAPTPITTAYNVVVTAQSRADSSVTAIAIVNLGAQETVTTPAAPGGPAAAVAGTMYQYSAGPAVSSLGHPVQYAFDWGDGTGSGWLAPGTATSFHAWSASGSYPVTVQARCATDTAVLSDPSAATTVTIAPAVPALTSISPASGAQGATVTVTLGGANFVSGATVAAANSGIAVSNVVVVSATQVTATFTIAANVAPGQVNVTVTTSAGTSAPVAFTVTGETISTPAISAGPASGVSGSLYQFTATGASSSMGHAIQYAFDWGDGSRSGWTPKGVSSSVHAWNAPGTYIVTVQARCTVDNSVLSAVAPGWTIAIAGESISTPANPAGPATALTGTASAYSTGGAASSLGHPVQYKFFWGDGSNTPWLPAGVTSASQTWRGPGTYSVTVQARCAADTQVVSQTSTALTVAVSAGETISAPAAPAGPSSGAPGTPYTYSTGGATSNAGNSVQYLFDWGDGATSGWLPVGTTSASHQWQVAGNYTVTAYAASSASLLIQSAASPSIAVTIQ